MLSMPALYRAAQKLIGSDNAGERFVSERLRVEPGQRILDMGCGPGLLLDRLEAVDYVGFDPSTAYISAAVERVGDRGEFIAGQASDISERDFAPFDVAVARGVLHHLDDEQALELLELAADSLVPGGKFVSIDPCLVDDQRFISRQLVIRDRGATARSPQAYKALIAQYFDTIDAAHHDDYLRVPYDHASFVATNNTPGSNAE